ncbi:MAG: OmpA family protein [Sphingobacteriales bacterium JAD_PAG50586_3]|nr:MAG: OmpA family protein [Sphingobacteriales bacterium JAD_PAG50586_3]
MAPILPYTIPMKNTIILYIGLVLLTFSCKAQPTLHSTNKKALMFYDNGTQYADRKQFDKAEEDLKKAIEADGLFIEAHLVLADIYYYQKKWDDAIKAYKTGIAIDPKISPKSIVALGKLEHSRGIYADAVTHYKQYLALEPDVKLDEKLKKVAQTGITNAEFAIDLMAKPVPYTPVNMGKGINSENSEYSAYMTADELTTIVTVNRPRDAQTVGPNSTEEDLYISFLKDGAWTQAKPLPFPVNSHDNEGSECISPNGQYLFFTGCQRPDGFGSCDLYVAMKTGGVWGEPFNLGEGVNSDKWDTQPSFSADGHTLYFVSTRSGGQGRADIWKAVLGENGQFSNPENLGPEINTPEDEFSPYIHPDGKSLYFASKGHPGMGGFDLQVARKGDDGKWGKPKNLGYPINTFADEISLFVASCSGKAYISSEKPGGLGRMDIYSFDLYADVAPARVTYIQGVITDKSTKAGLGAVANLVDLKTKQMVASAQADPKDGTYLVCLPSGGDYALEIAKDGYLFYSANFSLPASSECKPYKLNAALSAKVKGERVVLRNVFFDSDKFDLKSQSTVELDKLVDFLTKDAKLVIEIEGHTDSDGDDARNMALSDNRAKSVMNYLISKGIAASRLTAKGYGETKPLVANDTPDNKALNRRVEFVIK